MGAPFFANLTQWSDGDYPNSTFVQDDLAIIRELNFVEFREDDNS